MELNAIELIKMGMPISGVLLAMSMISLALIVERWFGLMRQFSQDKLLLKIARKMGPRDSVNRLAQAAADHGGPCSRVINEVLSAPQGHEKDQLSFALNKERSGLERGMAGLATIASIAPYVGLLGTCIGVIKAFSLISTAQGGGPAIVAGGIAEALFNTALGLFVAIPAVLAYNALAGWVNRHLREVAWTGQCALSHMSNIEGPTQSQNVLNIPTRENEFPPRQVFSQERPQSHFPQGQAQAPSQPQAPPPPPPNFTPIRPQEGFDQGFHQSLGGF